MHIAQFSKTLIIEDKKSFDFTDHIYKLPICNDQFPIETGKWINTKI